ncbi:unnamed protein product [Chrysodeixis includens]|uniref:Uncharacterized protein n=1 Tax=Chrysodeixis includens TaxID=689277 RepID=A0A9N8KQ35_CHRIL|nr:unnamed protein product [Chrysodeixis includens]
MTDNIYYRKQKQRCTDLRHCRAPPDTRLSSHTHLWQRSASIAWSIRKENIITRVFTYNSATCSRKRSHALQLLQINVYNHNRHQRETSTGYSGRDNKYTAGNNPIQSCK